ncbi:hypothetical protein [Antarcticimicrobium sediminis]|uniref:Uncharacterized protein n=1 Tax=Antarcticimicrobium sediminis TaxID=2546227 RepID=A0A4R5EFL9_9RHOB|nr:hypothetical protein [Antarcticimicrobium sediminis]TDE33181.1 hypothetical protein E1B25_21555 [Antarcticimicrobium sediminis]
MVWRYVWRILSSRGGLSVIICALLWGWHVHDRTQAVSTARAGFVRETEVAAVRAELDIVRRQMVAADVANRTLQEKVQVAEDAGMRFSEELEAFERDTKVNPDGVVDADLLRRLRAN